MSKATQNPGSRIRAPEMRARSRGEEHLREVLAYYKVPAERANICGMCAPLTPRTLAKLARGARPPTLAEAVILEKALEIHMLSWSESPHDS